MTAPHGEARDYDPRYDRRTNPGRRKADREGPRRWPSLELWVVVLGVGVLLFCLGFLVGHGA